MLKEKYIDYKSTYKNYLLLIKCGNFYVCLNEDAIVFNNIFKYKVIESSNFIKCGFPLSSLSKIEKKLEELEVNYVVINSDIVEKEKFDDNKYKNYLSSNNYDILLNRINKINCILKDNLNNNDIISILDDIESIVCKINY